jgi:hypothetical protein
LTTNAIWSAPVIRTASIVLLGIAALGIAAIFSTPAVASGIVACVKMDDDGNVAGAFIVVSSGDKQTDELLLSGVRNLHWGRPQSGETRNIWFPLGLAVGNETPPKGPSKCEPP